MIANKVIKGVMGVQVVLSKENEELINILRNEGYAVSVIELKNAYEGNDKDMLYIQINSDKLKELTKIIKDNDNSAFIVVNETKMVQNGLIK